MVYIQGMMAPVANEKKAHYQELAAKAGAVFRRNGAIAVIETWGDDLPDGKINDMKTAVKLKDGETTVFTWIVWPSKAIRDEGMQKSFTDPLFHTGFDPGMDGKRMFFGGFEPIIAHGDPGVETDQYVDGFLLAVPTANKQAYADMADMAWPFFQKYGALSLYECWGEDVMEGKTTSAAIATHKKDNETVVFSWIVWPSKEARMEGQTRMMSDPDFKPPAESPFDGSRMIYGGFEPIVSV